MSILAKKAIPAFPQNASQTRKWVNQLPTSNFGEMTRLLYVCMGELNKSQLPSATRIEVAEIIQPFAEMALNNLKKHLVARSFPLPERSQKIFNLNQSLLLEMAGAYQLAALDMLTKGTVNKKLLLLSVGRALNYMGRVLVNTYNVYIRPKEALWRDIHHLYLLACENKIDKLTVPDKSVTEYSCKTIEDYYKHISLLALSRPNTIRLGEITRLDAFFRVVLNSVSLFNDPAVATGKYAHIAMLNSDESPALMPVAELLNSPTIRLFNLSLVVTALKQFIKETNNAKSLGSNSTFPMLTHSLATRLLTTITVIRNRQFKRFSRDEQTPVVSHLSNIVKVIKTERNQDEDNISIDEDELFEELIYGENSSSSSPWAVSESENSLEDGDVELRVWHIENSSSEGYGLLWDHKDPSGVRSGELIALQDPSDDTEKWQIGTIRWMEFHQSKGLRAGVSLLSPHATSMQIKEISNREMPQNLPIEGLILPSIEGLKDIPYLILPDYMFRSGDKLTMETSKGSKNIQLGRIDEGQGAFALCEYTIVTTEDNPVEKNDSYQELWGSL